MRGDTEAGQLTTHYLSATIVASGSIAKTDVRLLLGVFYEERLSWDRDDVMSCQQCSPLEIRVKIWNLDAEYKFFEDDELVLSASVILTSRSNSWVNQSCDVFTSAW